MVAPFVFLPLAEETGLIGELSRWVMHEACRQAAAWMDEIDRPLRMAVNLSARDFQNLDVEGLVIDALAASGLPAQWLEVEITETAVLTDPKMTAEKVAALRECGLTVALDDFGTGYSSLTHLHGLPISRVKIDRSFVTHVREDESAAAIVTGMVRLIHSLKLDVVAEGVETPDELAFLRGVGCDEAQGFLFSRALPADECMALARRDMCAGMPTLTKRAD